jgi:hypothetical protein
MADESAAVRRPTTPRCSAVATTTLSKPLVRSFFYYSLALKMIFWSLIPYTCLALRLQNDQHCCTTACKNKHTTNSPTLFWQKLSTIKVSIYPSSKKFKSLFQTTKYV